MFKIYSSKSMFPSVDWLMKIYTAAVSLRQTDRHRQKGWHKSAWQSTLRQKVCWVHILPCFILKTPWGKCENATPTNGPSELLLLWELTLEDPSSTRSEKQPVWISGSWEKSLTQFLQMRPQLQASGDIPRLSCPGLQRGLWTLVTVRQAERALSLLASAS
jgi:hypothetical protein